MVPWQVIQGKNKSKIGFAVVVVFFFFVLYKNEKRWGDTRDDPFPWKRCISLPPTCKVATRISAQQLKTSILPDWANVKWEELKHTGSRVTTSNRRPRGGEGGVRVGLGGWFGRREVS